MKLLRKFWPLILFFFVWFVLFLPFFTKGLLPIPADIITGVYYPWLDYKWGFSVGVPVKNPLLSDIPSILYPWRSFVVDQIKSLQWPLWNPYYFGGMPLLANFQSAVFSYVNVFFLFFSKPIAWSLGVMVSPMLTMCFMYLFLKNKGLEKIPSVLGSIIFSLSGFEIAWMEYNVHGQTAMFLPLYLLTIDKLLRDKNWKLLLLLPILITFQIFAGYVPIVIYSAIICFFYILFFYFLPEFLSERINFWKYVLIIIFSIWGILLSSIQLLPGLELTNLSVRLTDPTVLASNASYLPLQNLVTALAPDFFGNPATGNYFGTAFYDNFYYFCGTATLVLVLFALFFLKKSRDTRFWFFIFLFSFVLIIKNPLGLFLEKVLFLSGGVASKALFMSDFSLAILAGLGLNELLKNGLGKKWKLIVPLLAILTGFVFSYFYSLKIIDLTDRLVAQRNLIIPFAFFVFFAVVSIGFFIKERFKFGKITIKSEIFRPIAGLAILVLITSQLLYSAKKYLPFSKKELIFPKTPVIEFLQQKKQESEEPFRVELGEVIPQNFLMPYKIETSSGYDALLPKRTAQFFSLVETGQIQEKLSRVWLLRNYESNLFPILNTKYFLAKKMDEKGYFTPLGKPPAIFENPRFKMVFEDKTVQVYEDKNFFPRAFWVYDYVENINDSSTAVNLRGTLDLKEKVYLDNPLKEVLRKPEAKTNGKINWKINSANKITLEVESDQSGYVFISKTNFPGWRAFVNDKEQTLYRANINFDAVFVPSGKNLLTLEYLPRSFSLGKVLTIFAFGGWCLSVFFSLLKNYILTRRIVKILK